LLPNGKVYDRPRPDLVPKGSRRFALVWKIYSATPTSTPSRSHSSPGENPRGHEAELSGQSMKWADDCCSHL
jgi:hypothetical protein